MKGLAIKWRKEAISADALARQHENNLELRTQFSRQPKLCVGVRSSWKEKVKQWQGV